MLVSRTKANSKRAEPIVLPGPGHKGRLFGHQIDLSPGQIALTAEPSSFFLFFLSFFFFFLPFLRLVPGRDFYRGTENTWSRSMAPLIKWKGGEPLRRDFVVRGTRHAPNRVSW